ncbi:hypothetical protein PQR02_05530 [Paraburkholderia sediminicola]|uniref:Uncharacterized protein n=1 Tax=Paraburkholderia rhynchosiae TaxID=487049 RepID=A0ACC7N8R6_9BURK
MIIVSFCFLLVTRYVFSRKTERKARLEKAGRRIAIVGSLFLLLVLALKYQADARARTNAPVSGQSISTPDGGLYLATYAYLGREEVLLRLYRRNDMALIAERTYTELDEVGLVWNTDKLIYDTSAFDGHGLYRLAASAFGSNPCPIPLARGQDASTFGD